MSILVNLKNGDKIRIKGFNCGKNCSGRFKCMGFIIGRIITIKFMQPLHGPITVEMDGAEYTIGRGMMEKLEYEVIDETG